MNKAIVLILFAAALAAAVLVATERAHSMGADDTTPPVGWAALPAVVSSVHVDVVAAVVDPETGVIEMRLSNDGRTWSGWQAYPTPSPDLSLHLPWELSPGDGAKTVTVEARNGVGLVATFTAHTILRSRGPDTGARSSAATRPT